MAVRLDKYLAHANMGTRSEVKKLIRSGRVFLNGVAAKKPEEKVFDGSEVVVDGEVISPKEYEYFMLNKPQGVVSATQDCADRTVVDLITCPHSRELFPVGRLDKDTEGLLLLTNDGTLAHQLLSPKKHVSKTYLVWVEGEVTQEDVALLENGIDIGDEKLTKPAVVANIYYYDLSEEKAEEVQTALELTVTNKATGLGQRAIESIQTSLELTITEGRYHQIKRMFAKIGKPVQYLKRLSMGSLKLDSSLELGEFRQLTEEEILHLKKEEY